MCVCVYYLDETLTTRYQQRGYIPKVLQNSKGSTGQKNKCKKTKLIILNESYVRLFYQLRFFYVVSARRRFELKNCDKT
jgi:hypothetical protein